MSQRRGRRNVLPYSMTRYIIFLLERDHKIEREREGERGYDLHFAHKLFMVALYEPMNTNESKQDQCSICRHPWKTIPGSWVKKSSCELIGMPLQTQKIFLWLNSQLKAFCDQYPPSLLVVLQSIPINHQQNWPCCYPFLPIGTLLQLLAGTMGVWTNDSAFILPFGGAVSIYIYIVS